MVRAPVSIYQVPAFEPARRLCLSVGHGAAGRRRPQVALSGWRLGMRPCARVDVAAYISPRAELEANYAAEADFIHGAVSNYYPRAVLVVGFCGGGSIAGVVCSSQGGTVQGPVQLEDSTRVSSSREVVRGCRVWSRQAAHAGV